MNEFDVLERAKNILNSAPLPEDHAEHGDYCPYCAISLAKTQLDEENGTSVGLLELLPQIATGIVELDSDSPLIEARKLISHLAEPFTKTKTITAITSALSNRTTSSC